MVICDKMQSSIKKDRNLVTQFLQKHYPKEKAIKYELSIHKNVRNDYCKEAYEKIGEILNAKDENERTMIIEDAESSWDSYVYKDHREKYIAAINKTQKRPKPVKGLYTCRSCGSDEFYIWSAQTRSSDEGMTHYRQCYKCGKRNKE